MLESIYVFLIRWDIPIYALSGLSFVVGLFRFLAARMQLRQALFSLERERARLQQGNAAIMLAVSAVIGGIVLYTNLQIAPTLPADVLQRPTPTPNVFALSSPTPIPTADAVGTPRPRVTPNLVATATLPGDTADSSSPAPNLPPATVPVTAAAPPPLGGIPDGGGCNPAVSITNPQPDTVVFGTVEIRGTATTSNFGSYTLEIRGMTTGNRWTDLLGGEIFNPVEANVLGGVNLGALENGRYDLRLVVYDLSGTPAGQCTISVMVENE